VIPSENKGEERQKGEGKGEKKRIVQLTAVVLV